MKTGLFYFSMLSLFLLLPLQTKGEYRAFLIEIRTPEGELVREVTSTLDPLQYRTYYPLPKEYSALYTQTWMCYGRTSHQPICPNPKNEQRTPASEDSPATNP